jgi:hypothetical protein
MTIAFLLADGFVLCMFSHTIEQVGAHNTVISGPVPVHFVDISGETALDLSVRCGTLMTN